MRIRTREEAVTEDIAKKIFGIDTLDIDRTNEKGLNRVTLQLIRDALVMAFREGIQDGMHKPYQEENYQ